MAERRYVGDFRRTNGTVNVGPETERRVKKGAPSRQAAQRFESDSTAQLIRAGASPQLAKSLVSQAYAAFVSGEDVDLPTALERVVAQAGGNLHSALALDRNRVAAVGSLAATTYPDDDNVSAGAAASQGKEIERQSATVTAENARADAADASIRSQAGRIVQADNTVTVAKARVRVLKERPDLYRDATARGPVLAEGDGTIAEIVAAAMSVALRKKLDAGIPVGIASRDLMRDNAPLRQLAALAQSEPISCGLGMVEASRRITKSRPDVDVPGLLGQVLTADVIIKLGKRRGL